MTSNMPPIICAAFIGFMLSTRPPAAHADVPGKGTRNKCEGSAAPGTDASMPADPLFSCASISPLVAVHMATGLSKVSTSYTWSICDELTLFFNYEQLIAGDVLRRQGIPSGSYGYVGATFRY